MSLDSQLTSGKWAMLKDWIFCVSHLLSCVLKNMHSSMIRVRRSNKWEAVSLREPKFNSSPKKERSLLPGHAAAKTINLDSSQFHTPQQVSTEEKKLNASNISYCRCKLQNTHINFPSFVNIQKIVLNVRYYGYKTKFRNWNGFYCWFRAAAIFFWRSSTPKRGDNRGKATWKTGQT